MTIRFVALLVVCAAATGACATHSTSPLPAATTAVADAPLDYDLTVHILPDDQRVEISGTVRLAATNMARAEIPLSLSERMVDLHVAIVEPSLSAGPANVERADGRGRNANAIWTVHPVRPIPPGQAVLLRFSYTGGGQAASMYYVGPEVAFASAWGTDWYPLVKTDPDKGTGLLTVSVPAGWSVVTGGASRSSEREEAKGTFRSAILHPTYFSFAAGKYSVVRHTGSVPVSAYLLKPREHTDAYLQGVEGILQVLTSEFGSFPFEQLALIEVPRDIATQAGFNAVGAAGLLVLNSRAFNAPDTKYLLEWLGHELGHQWFPQTVALRTPPGLYMEEALAEYGGLRVVETIAGPAAAKQFRTSGFEYDPIYSALGYFKLVGAGIDQPLSDLQPTLEHRNLAYNKGFLVFDMLSRELGRAEFQRILREIIRQHRFQSLTWHELLDAIEHGAGRKLDWFFEQWFGRRGAPDFELSWRQEGDTVRGVIEQAEPAYRVRLKVDMRGSDGGHLVSVVETLGPRQSFVQSVGFKVDAIVLDPDYEVLRWTPEYRTAAAAVRVP